MTVSPAWTINPAEQVGIDVDVQYRFQPKHFAKRRDEFVLLLVGQRHCRGDLHQNATRPVVEDLQVRRDHAAEQAQPVVLPERVNQPAKRV